MPQFVIAALYQFVSLPDYRELRDPLKAFCVAQGIKGTLLLAEEGINGTVAGSRAAIDALKSWLAEDGRFDNLEYKESFDDDQPFYRMKVNLKKEIVTMGVQGIDPNKKVGTYVDPQDWNELISDPDVILIDTRNDYEYRIGTFRNAVDPETATFREFPKYVADNLDPKRHRKVAMFCTGGIRCEKATAFMLEQGFDEVYHLKGGILNYLEKIPEAGSLWDGECFVFDNRVSIKHGLEVGEHVLCHACRMPLSEEDRASEDFKEGVSCPHCIEELTERKRQRFSERQRQVELAEARNQVHVGQVLPS